MKKWRETITDEINRILEKHVWDSIESETLPTDKKTLTMKWVFKEQIWNIPFQIGG